MDLLAKKSPTFLHYLQHHNPWELFETLLELALQRHHHAEKEDLVGQGVGAPWDLMFHESICQKGGSEI